MKTSKKLAFSLITLAVFAALVTLVFYASGPVTPPPPPETPGLYRPSEIEGLEYEHVPGASGVVAGVTVSFNALGLRGGEVPPEKPPGETWIAVIGDSIVFGQGVEKGGSLSEQIEDELGELEPGRKWRALNFGVRGYNSMNYVPVVKEKALPLDPDLLVLVITEINDPELAPFKVESKKLARWKDSAWTKLPFAREALAGAYAAEFNRLFKQHVRDIYADDGEDWKAFRSDIAEIASLCETRSVPVVAVTFPFLDGEDLFEPEREKLQAMLGELGMRWVDPRPSFEGIPAARLVVSDRDFHPNARAFALTAELVAPALLAAEEQAAASEEEKAGGPDYPKPGASVE